MNTPTPPIPLSSDPYESHVEPVAGGTVKLETRALDFFYGKTQALHDVSIPFADGTVKNTGWPA